jgi:tRNA-uridine 2-sulfurtransferase
MSGGVDSSVAAALLKEQGRELVGVTLHLWDAQGSAKVGRCCSAEDQEDARRTCDHLGIDHYVIDERRPFREHVVDPFIQTYVSGETPSPCTACNQHVKLARLVELADLFGASHIATGHYARLEHDGARSPRILRGVDRKKDQSYFLFGVPAAVRARLLFPLGELTKAETRSHGRRLGIANADKPDSQQLCFVPDGNIAGFVEEQAGPQKSGRLVNAAGQGLATHQGIHRFTVGQRRGLGISGARAAYVLRILPDTGDVVVGEEDGLWAEGLSAVQVTWAADRPAGPFTAAVRIRYRHEPAAATVFPTDAGFTVQFAQAQRAITPGQAVVVYRGEEVVAGGYIAA